MGLYSIFVIDNVHY
ncbi:MULTISPECIES: ErmCL family antibiotic resistance leader peptide [Aerococcaceae]